MAVLLGACLSGPGPAPGTAQTAPAADAAAGAGRRADGFAARADSMVRAAVADGGLPGVALAVVRGGETTFSGGYGVADLEEGTPVSPGGTRFSAGSVSKLVTAVVVLQLADAGRLSLSEPVGRDGAGGILPPGPGRPVTLHDLLTHTSGLEPANVGLASHIPPDAGELRAYLSRAMPARTQPPGRLYLYSQFGYGLAGLLAAEASGEPFARHAAEHVFGPLGMGRSSFRQEALAGPATASGYYLDGADTVPAPVAYHRIPPAGGLVTTADDLARLAGALVGSSRPDSGRILSHRARRRLLDRQWSPHPLARVEGTAYGLFEHRACGLRALTTRGWVGGHSAYLHLVPARGAAFVLLGNANVLGGLEIRLRRALHRELAGNRCPAGGAGVDEAGEDAGRGTAGDDRRGAPGAAAAGSGARRRDAEGRADRPSLRPGRFFGHYRAIGFSGRGVEALGRLFLAPQVKVGPGPDGTEIDFGDARVAAEPAGRRLLRSSWREGQVEHFAFVEGDDGEVGYMMWGGIAYEQVPPYRTVAAVTVATVLLGALFAAGLLAASVRLVRAGWTGGEGNREAGVRRLHAGAGIVALASVVLAAVLVLHLDAPARYRFAFGIPLPVRIALRLPYVMLAGGAVVVVGALRARRRGAGTGWERAAWLAVGAGGLFAGAVAWRIGLPLL